MGSKAGSLGAIAAVVEQEHPGAMRVIDLFGGSGAVSLRFSESRRVHFNDVQRFAATMGKALLLPLSEHRIETTDLLARVDELAGPRLAEARKRIDEEVRASTRSGDGIEALIQAQAERLGGELEGSGDWVPSEYFEHHYSRGYFSTKQAIYLDAIRNGIDEIAPAELDTARAAGPRDVWIAALVSAASRIANSPGHTAQFLHARTAAGQRRTSEYWSRDLLGTFAETVSRVTASTKHRSPENSVTATTDIRALTDAAPFESSDVVFADPPYSREQYSRYYHLLETICVNDRPRVRGAGLVREQRYRSPYSLRTEVQAAFTSLCQETLALGTPLIVTYPTRGLLEQSGGSLEETLARFGHVTRSLMTVNHSMLGSQPRATAAVTETIYSVMPR